MFFLLRKIPHIPNRNKIIETAKYFTKSIKAIVKTIGKFSPSGALESPALGGESGGPGRKVKRSGPPHRMQWSKPFHFSLGWSKPNAVVQTVSLFFFTYGRGQYLERGGRWCREKPCLNEMSRGKPQRAAFTPEALRCYAPKVDSTLPTVLANSRVFCLNTCCLFTFTPLCIVSTIAPIMATSKIKLAMKKK